MPTVWIPPLLRSLTKGRSTLQVSGSSLGEVIDSLEEECPGLRDRLLDGNELRPGLAVGIGNQAGRFPLDHPIGPADEVHFVNAVGGG